MLGSALAVLIVDDDAERAAALARVVRLYGAVAVVSDRFDPQPEHDVLLVDDDSFAGSGAEIARFAARISPWLFRCINARTTRFADVRDAAEWILVKPLTSSGLADVLRAAERRSAFAAAHP